MIIDFRAQCRPALRTLIPRKFMPQPATLSPPLVDRMLVWVYSFLGYFRDNGTENGSFCGIFGLYREYGFGSIYNKIPIYPIFYLFKGEYTSLSIQERPGMRAKSHICMLEPGNTVLFLQGDLNSRALVVQGL